MIRNLTASRELRQDGLCFFLYALQEFKKPQPSLEKARICVQSRVRHYQKAEGKPTSNSRATLIKNWNAFKGVSHLWAAVVLSGRVPEQLRDDFVDDPVALRKFLAIAEEIQKFGEAYVSPCQRHPLVVLPADAMWRVPESYDLPKCKMELTGGRLWPWAEEALSNYKHKR